MAVNGALGWDSPIENDDAFQLVEGEFNFTVKCFERGSFDGSEKITPCDKATLTLSVETEDGVVDVRTDLLLHTVVEWKLSEFFRCIGQKKKGERLIMNWNKVPGSRGRAIFKPRKYTKDGEERQINNVERFLDYDEKYFPDGDFMKIDPADAEELPFN